MAQVEWHRAAGAADRPTFPAGVVTEVITGNTLACNIPSLGSTTFWFFSCFLNGFKFVPLIYFSLTACVISPTPIFVFFFIDTELLVHGSSRKAHPLRPDDGTGRGTVFIEAFDRSVVSRNSYLRRKRVSWFEKFIIRKPRNCLRVRYVCEEKCSS